MWGIILPKTVIAVRPEIKVVVIACFFKYSSFRKVVAFRILVGTEWALLVGSILFPDFEMWSFISARVKKGIHRMSADQPSDGKLKGCWVAAIPELSSLFLSKHSLRFVYTESGSGSTIFWSRPSLIYSSTLNRREDKIVFKLWLPQLQSRQARREISANRSKYEHPTFSLIVLLFSVLSMYRPYISARNEVLHFLAWQAIYLEEKLQEYRLLWAHVKQPFVTIKTQGKAGLTGWPH